MFEALIVGLILGCFGAYLTWRNGYKTRRANMCAAFRAAFAPDLAALDANTFGGRDPIDLLTDAYVTRHLAAFEGFFPYLTRGRHARLTDDWNRYRYGERDDGSPETTATADMCEADLRFLCYSIEFHLTRPEVPRELAIKRIRKLLSHASET